MSVRGTKSYFGADAANYKSLEQIFFKITQQFGAQFIKTSALQEAKIFFKSAGSSSDICNKEMFVVENMKIEPGAKTDFDKTVLQPEATASVVHTLATHHTTFNHYLRVAYFDRMYRYNRPQKHRLRELTQAGVEFFGKGVLVDFEAIQCAVTLLTQLGLIDQVTLRINNIGSAQTRAEYAAVLGQFFQAHQDKISQISENPLRTLDKLTAAEKANLPGMPLINQSLPQSLIDSFNELLHLLDLANIKYIVDPTIIRGLDYYAHTVFEFTTDETTLLAGGRYDTLVSTLTKQDCSGVGWALGVERALSYMTEKESTPQLTYLANMNATRHALKVADHLRQQGMNILVIDCFHKDLHKLLRNANNNHLKEVVLVGENECAAGTYIVKNMQTSVQNIYAL